jgi:hypothetical protein
MDVSCVCVQGMRFGLMQVKTGLIQLLSRYEIAPCRDTPRYIAFDPKAFVLCTVGEMLLCFSTQKIDVTST